MAGAKPDPVLRTGPLVPSRLSLQCGREPCGIKGFRGLSGHIPSRRGLLAGTLAGLATAPAAYGLTPDGTGPNSNIVRWAGGNYVYRRASDRKFRGGESFYMTVHPDGSRTMRAATDIAVRNVQANVVMRVDADFRPIEAYCSIFSQGAFKGSAMLRVNGTEMTADLGGPTPRTFAVPRQFSLVTHPLALDGWHSWYASKTAGEKQAGTVFMIDGDADPAKPFGLHGQPLSIRYVGQERLTVPAGRFDTDHFVLAESIDVWTTGPDHLLVRYLSARSDQEYLLTTLRTTGQGPGSIYTKNRGQPS